MQSLLGQFYTRIKGSQEDIASEGLVYILTRSQSASETLRRMITIDCGLTLPELSFISQSTGVKLERPDITGSDEDGRERLIIESKFWASLTENQPAAYLSRLTDNSVLMFICPTLRVRPIFAEVLKRLNNEQISFAESPDNLTIKLSDDRYIIIKTWDELLGAIKLALVQENNPALISDIDQIIGFCKIIDNEAFLPITAEDMSPSIARRLTSYYDLVDKVTDELKKKRVADTEKLRATGQKYGYTRFFRIRKFGLGLYIKFDNWSKEADTPFWLWINETKEGHQHWVRSNGLKHACKEVAAQKGYKLAFEPDNVVFFAIFPLLNRTEDMVINDMANQIITIVDLVEQRMNEQVS